MLSQVLVRSVDILKHVTSMCAYRNWLYMDRVKRIWYLSPMRAAKVQASLRIRAVLPEPLLLAHIGSESRGTFRQKARSLAPLNGWACAVKICNDGMLEDTNSLDGAYIMIMKTSCLTVFRIQMSHVMRKPALCHSNNKGADQPVHTYTG